MRVALFPLLETLISVLLWEGGIFMWLFTKFVAFMVLCELGEENPTSHRYLIEKGKHFFKELVFCDPTLNLFLKVLLIWKFKHFKKKILVLVLIMCLYVHSVCNYVHECSSYKGQKRA